MNATAAGSARASATALLAGGSEVIGTSSPTAAWDAVSDLYALLTEPGASYEGASRAYDQTLAGLDADYVEAVQARLLAIGSLLYPNASAIVNAYGALALVMGGATVDPLNPLAVFYQPPSGWTGPQSYAGLEARLTAEADALEAAAIPAAAAIADLLRERSVLDHGLSLLSYEQEVTYSVLVEAATRGINGEDPRRVLAFVEPFAYAIDNLPRKAIGRRPGYVVTKTDSLETVARAVYGDASRWTDLVAALNLAPPYLDSVVRPGCLYPGARIALPHDAQSATEEEAYGLTFALTITNEPDHQEWDIAEQNGDIQILGGLNALMAELSLRAMQPLGDWVVGSDEGEAVARYGVPEVIGEPGPRVSVDTSDFGLAQALLEDPRVEAATPLAVSSPEGDFLASTLQAGLFIQSVVVTPKSAAE